LKRYFVGILLLAAISAVTFWWLNRQPTLLDLQKDYLFAKTDAEREKIIDRLEDYYLNLSIPDSIRLHVDEEIDTLLVTTEINVAEFSQENWDTTNVYDLENRLKSLLRIAMIARAREEVQTFQGLMDLAKKMAETVDVGTQANYWVPFFEEVAKFDREQAFSWMKANVSASYCYRYHDKMEYWKAAEKYGSLGLQYLKYIEDHRLQVNIMQRFQYILFMFRGTHELSVALAERFLQFADNINDHLRANGIAYHQAEALYQSGQVKAALNLFQKVVKRATVYRQIPSMIWYKKNGIIFIADAYWQLGQYENALYYCNKFEQFNLANSEIVHLHNIRGLVQRSLGNYEGAETEYKYALDFTDSNNVNIERIKLINNLGFLNFLLTEYDQALNYYFEAKSLLEKFNPENYEYKMNLIINIAQVLTQRGDFDELDELIDEANKLTKLGKLPWRRADFLNTIGNLNLTIEKNHLAYNNFLESLSICENNGLIRLGLVTKLGLAESLIRLSRFSEAKNVIVKAYSTATQIDDAERIIDSIAKLAKLEKIEGNLENAVLTSKRLIPKIENIFSRFNNENRMISFLQKIYDYLKEAVIYELQYQRADSAYVLLNYAKARSFKNHKNFGNGHIESNGSLFHSFDINTLQSRLKESSIVIDYLVAEDTLYVFILDHENLQVLSKAIDIDELKNAVDAYKASINKTITLFRNDYNETLAQAHFDLTIQQSKKLFEQLLGWPSLIAKIKANKRLFLIPDEFLYDLPFATLMENVSEKGSFLAQNAAIVTLPSASFIRSVGGNLSFSNLQEKRILVSADPDIPGSKEFVAFIKEQFPFAEELSVNKFPFDKTDVLTKLNEGHDIYIFVGHGSANSTYPDLSFIELSATNAITSDIKTFQVTISDLKQINWPGAEMVILVGCETGSGKIYRGTGIVGLQQGFVSLGSQNVLASLWKIDATKTIPQVKNFIGYLNDYSDPVMALEKVQLESIQQLFKSNYYKKPHPYYWGSFILSSKTN